MSTNRNSFHDEGTCELGKYHQGMAEKLVYIFPLRKVLTLEWLPLPALGSQ